MGRISNTAIIGVCAPLLCMHTLLHAAASALHRDSAHAAAAADTRPDSKYVFGWWDIILHGSRAELWLLLSPQWWISYIAAEFESEPAHVIVEAACIAVIIYLLAVRKPAPMHTQNLTIKEEDELIAEWKPEALCPLVPESTKTRFVVDSVTGRTVQANGQTYLNFAATNFLGLADKPHIKAACRDTIEKYGVGSCGPRGFYGTFDVHLEVESRLTEFLGAEECILYSDAIATVSSVIPAFAKKGDTIVVDESCSFAVQQGCLLSRSSIHYFKHGDVADLERVLKELAAKERKSGKSKGAPMHRKFIVVEGVSTADGAVAPLPAIIKLKDQYKFRMILDDSLGFGTMGATGRGTLEHFGLDVNSVDALCATMDGALASVGGFCAGSHQVVDHQRLSGAGYCFSASSPPYTSTASIKALECMDEDPSLCASLRARATRARRALATVHKDLVVLGSSESSSSPVIHLALKGSAASSQPNGADLARVNELQERLIAQHAIVVVVPEHIPADRSVRHASLRILLSVLHTDADIDKLVKAMTQVAQAVLGR